MKTLLKILITIFLAFLCWLLTAYIAGINASGQTEELCREYAERDHSKEIAPERRQWLLEQGYDYNKDFDWYQSCIKHSSNY